MGVPILILGESGTGKSTSLRNFKNGELAVVNVAGKPLPFKGKFETISGTTDFKKIYTFLKTTKSKSIVVDDAQYIMSFQYMRRITENGWDKFNELQSDFFNLIDCVKDLPDDVIVYFLSHIETKEDGRQKIKTIGKMLDEKITIEGMFTVVLKTYTADGKYYFLTQNSGSDTTKSPMGMFPSYAIDNDLKYVDEKIRNYYELGEFLTDEEIDEIDKEAQRVDVIKDEVEGKKKRGRRKNEEKGHTEDDGSTVSNDAPKGRRRRKSEENTDDNGESADKSSQESNDVEPPKRRSRNERRAKAAEEQVMKDMESIAEDEDREVLFDEVESPEPVSPPRRKRRGVADEQKQTPSENEENPASEEKEEPSQETTGKN